MQAVVTFIYSIYLPIYKYDNQYQYQYIYIYIYIYIRVHNICTYLYIIHKFPIYRIANFIVAVYYRQTRHSYMILER